MAATGEVNNTTPQRIENTHSGWLFIVQLKEQAGQESDPTLH
ncbi:mCG1043933 [Mus musculus]|nr:mCG1043933 [Mus musculus]